MAFNPGILILGNILTPEENSNEVSLPDGIQDVRHILQGSFRQSIGPGRVSETAVTMTLVLHHREEEHRKGNLRIGTIARFGKCKGPHRVTVIGDFENDDFLTIY